MFIAIKPLLRFPIKCKVNRILKPTTIELGSSVKIWKKLEDERRKPANISQISKY